MSDLQLDEPTTSNVGLTWLKRSPLYSIYEQALFVKWLVSMRHGRLPAIQKRRLIRQYARHFGIDTFVETGTYLGGTVNVMRKHFDKVVSIELDKTLAHHAQGRFSFDTKVTILQGDSASLLPPVATQLEGPALYWLDGHFSGGVTARGELDTPLYQELQSILAEDHHDSVILIDDAYLLGSGDYPTFQEITTLVAEARPGWSVEFRDDLVRVLPA